MFECGKLPTCAGHCEEDSILSRVNASLCVEEVCYFSFFQRDHLEQATSANALHVVKVRVDKRIKYRNQSQSGFNGSRFIKTPTTLHII